MIKLDSHDDYDKNIKTRNELFCYRNGFSRLLFSQRRFAVWDFLHTRRGFLSVDMLYVLSRSVMLSHTQRPIMPLLISYLQGFPKSIFLQSLFQLSADFVFWYLPQELFHFERCVCECLFDKPCVFVSNLIHSAVYLEGTIYWVIRFKKINKCA